MDVLSALQSAVVDACLEDISQLDDDACRDLAVGLETAAGQLRAKASTLLGKLAAQDSAGAAHWWRDALKLSGEAAGRAVRRAEGLRDLPEVSDAAVRGDLSLEQAGAFIPLVDKIDEAQLDDMQPMLVEGGRGRTVESIGHWVRTLITINSEKDLEREQESARDRRYWKHRMTSDGLMRGSFAFTAEDAEAVLPVLEALARKQGDEDERTAPQRRADAAVEVFAGAATWMDLPNAGGQRAQISYVMPAAWAAGLPGADPARGAWTGPQTRGRMEAMLCDGRLTRLLLDAEGQVASLVAVNDQITLAQRRAVSARDRCCVARGCTRPPAFCDVHHLISRKDGGPTVLGNLALLCRRHHLMWHDGRIQLPDLDVPWLRTPLDPPMVA